MRTPTRSRLLPTPPDGDELECVAAHLGHLAFEPAGQLTRSRRYRGGQVRADAALAALDITGYARRRSTVLPVERRGATGLSPFLRHGLLALPRLWDHVVDAGAADRQRFRDELLWQEYARHVYARLGRRTAAPLRHRPTVSEQWDDPWPGDMACMELTVGELEGDGWLVNQTRMWMASQWTVRHGAPWNEGEDRFFRHLLDGSRAANRLGWQWTIGAATGKPYGFSRWQVEKRALGLCATCRYRHACPIQRWPNAPPGERVDEPAALRHDPDPAATGGPVEPTGEGGADVVWVTAESLGDDDPALGAHPDLPVVFVFDERLLERLTLSSQRLCFLAETLSDLATRRTVEVWLGDPLDALAGRAVASTFAPVLRWRRYAAKIDAIEVHPWPWLVRPHGGSARSYTAWRKTTG
ncbi:MAG: FAD-binding domain-containing protein [Ilumatobacteraceae bacterium]